MMITKGEMLRNKISHDLFTVKKIVDSKVVMLEDEKGYACIWLQSSNIGSFFEKTERMEC